MPLEPPSSRLVNGAEVRMENWGTVVLGEVIGQGGMGLVRRAWMYHDPQGPRAGTPTLEVAVKILHPFLLGRHRARGLFLREAAALQRLRHPNIVQFFGLVEQFGQLAIVIEFVEGQTLDRVIAHHVAQRQHPDAPALPFMLAWHYFAQLLGALSAVHHLGIIHRDVKPANILIRTDGIAKLTDFGIARVPQEAVVDTGGMAPGTGAYMAPEQVSGGELDARSDLYAAAIVLFEMLTGTTPFEAPGRNEVMIRAAQLEDSPAPLTSVVRSAPPVMDVLLARAMAKDKMHRYGSGIEFGDAIQRALQLPEIEGWKAQKQLAKHAKAISEMVPSVQASRDAEQLRTDAMSAFKM
jgi:serine/threonine-protein kinase